VSRIRSFWLVLVVLNLLLATVSGVAVGQGDSTPSQVTDAQTGKATLLSFNPGALGMPVRDVRTAALATSSDIVARYAAAFGAATGSEYTVLAEPFTLNSAPSTATAVRYRQTLGGLPVYTGQLVVNVRGDGAATLMSGKVTSADVSTLKLTPKMSAAVAGQSALTYVSVRYGVPVESLALTDAGLWVYDPAIVKPGVSSADRAGVVWQAVVTSRVGQPIRVVALVDAQRGTVRFAFNSIHASPQYGDWQSARAAGVNFGAGLIGPAASNALTLPDGGVRVQGTADLATYDTNNSDNLPGTFVCDESNLACTNGADADADSAHTHANGTYDFYFDIHGRDSLNGLGLLLKSTVHLSAGYCNAFWSGEQMAYGDGCTGGSIVTDDVVAHELTHGVTEFSSNLIYAYDSGAINESFSDVWGEYYDLSNGTAEDIPANRWVIGEEFTAGEGFRDMQDPTIHGDPDRVGSPNFWTDARDTGGVHINSGINNKAAYLMADGDTFNGQTITGIGLVKPLHIYYYVQTLLATETTTYNELATYLNAACTALIGGAAGITAGDCTQVAKAVLATEMALPSPHLPDSATVCDGGFAPSVLFSDDFENTTTSANRWTTAALKGKNAWTVSSSSFPLHGLRSMRADNVGGNTTTPVSNSTSTMTTGITGLPADAYLYFSHQYVWEYDGWDGAVVQYSTNNGSTWTTFSNADMTGELYPGRANDESSIPFAGLFAYTGDSFGEGSTRISLAALAGMNVKIRFYASSDEAYSAGNPDGWWIDDVSIYTCGASDELLVNGGFEVGPARPPLKWVVANKSGTTQNDKRMCNTQTKIYARTGACAFRFVGGASENTKLTQKVNITGRVFTTGDLLSLTGYYNAAASSSVFVKVTVTYTDAAPTIASLNLLADAGYQPFTVPSATLSSGNVTSIKVNFTFKGTTSGRKVLLDDLSLTSSVGPRSDGSSGETFRGLP